MLFYRQKSELKIFCYMPSSVTLFYVVPIPNPAAMSSFFCTAHCLPSCASRTGLSVTYPYKISVCPFSLRSGTGFFHRISSGNHVC